MTQDLLRKRLYFQSAHRGTKENDLMLTRFADAHLKAMVDGDLAVYDRLLQEPDGKIYAWLAQGATDYPAEYTVLIGQIRAANGQE